MKIFYYLIPNNILDVDSGYVEQKFKAMGEFKFVELINLKISYEKFFLMEAFSILHVYKNIVDLDGLKCELKSVYAAKSASSIHEDAEIIRELELNQTLAEETKLLHLILTKPGISASCERSM